MSKHTPGPWKAGRSDMSTIVYGVESKWVYAGEKYVAVASGRVGDWAEVMANARLIAAAPDLLEALEQTMCETMGEFDRTCISEGLLTANPDVVCARCAAIAKATGDDS